MRQVGKGTTSFLFCKWSDCGSETPRDLPMSHSLWVAEALFKIRFSECKCWILPFRTLSIILPIHFYGDQLREIFRDFAIYSKNEKWWETILFYSIYRPSVQMEWTDVPGSITLSVGQMELLILMNACYVWKISEYKLEFLLKYIF